jgi:3-methyladenine DNA glycosylase AlkD
MLEDTPDDLLALVTSAQDALAQAAVPSAAPAMARYMRDLQPFYGVSRPLRAPIERALIKRFIPVDLAAYQAGVQALWAGPMREERYLALAYARGCKGYPRIDALDLYLLLVREGAWWDLVDEIAGRILSPLYLTHRDALYDEVEAWSQDTCLWVRRCALLAHLKHGAHTDAEQLFRHCLLLADEPDFFIRKAIGWSLRTYAHHAPDRVRAFLNTHRASLSRLSVREASKHL